MNDRLLQIQESLLRQGLDGWLFFDHHERDPISYGVLKFRPPQKATRRWYYLLPAQGEPIALVHAIESGILDPLPGQKKIYSNWKSQRAMLGEILAGLKSVAMQFSPLCAIPYVATVDAGTVDLVRHFVPDVRTSATLVQEFEARWSGEQLESHLEAGRRMDRIRHAAFQLIADRTRSGVDTDEFSVKTFLLGAFEKEGLETDHGPIVATDQNCSNPHYEPSNASSRAIRQGSPVLIDMWAKLRQPNAVFYDITWTGFCGDTAPEPMLEVFAAVTGARDAAIALVQSSVGSRQPLMGYQVDDAAREYLKALGMDHYFVHRTGHSIGSDDVHGNGANMDNWETHDEREIIPRTCFSVEPGVYRPDFGIRSEVNVYVDDQSARVTGEKQERLLLL